MPELSFDWVWIRHLRDDYLSLSERDRADLSLRVAFVSANPWPDFSSKRFFDDPPPDLWEDLIRSQTGWHLIIYADEEWVLIYEVVQPFVIVFYAFARLPWRSTPHFLRPYRRPSVLASSMSQSGEAPSMWDLQMTR